MTTGSLLARTAGWRGMMIRGGLMVLLGTAALVPGSARADQDAGVSDGGSPADLERVGIQPTTTPDNLGCSMTRPRADGAAAWGGLACAMLLAGGLGRRRVSARRALRIAVAVAVSQAVAARPAVAQPQNPEYQTASSPTPEQTPYAQPVATEPALAGGTTLQDPPLYKPTGRRRHFAITFNPLTLLLSRYGLNVEAMLASHHVLIGTVYYAYTRTNDDSANNIFRGVGGEVGYRYYFGKNGPRGLYLGPSFLIGHFEAIPRVGDTVPYWNYGAALDLGYQYLVADRVTLGLGAGIQYTAPTQTFPAQELPASIYAIAGVRPRLLLALGVAF